MSRLPLCVVSLVTLTWAQSPSTARVEAIRFWSFGDVTRIAIQTEGDYKLFSDQIDKPARVYFDLTGLRPPATVHRGFQTISINDRLVKQIRVAEVAPAKTRIVFDLNAPADVLSSQLVNPDRLMIEIRPKSQPKPTVSLARSTTGSQKIDLSSEKTNPESEMLSIDKGVLSAAKGEGVRSAKTASPTPAAENKVSPPAPDVKQAEPSRDQVTPAVPAALSSHPISTPLTLGPAKSPASEATSSDAPSSIPTVGSHEAPPVAPAPAKLSAVIAAAKRDSTGDRSLVRVLGLKLGRVVIDAGHGGHDTGTIGPDGLMEKDLVLDVALRLGKLITQQLGAEVVYTRSGDVFIPLEQRTKIANTEKADLFISIHANSSPEPSASGVETFYFNLTSDKVGLDLATRENATSVSSISDLNDLLHKAVLENKLEESREFAQKIQAALWTTSLKMNTRSRDRGVRHAPFVVLIGATMPSILAEIGFVSNPHDERFLQRNDQRQKLAEALLKGISQYASTLSHVQLATVSSK